MKVLVSMDKVSTNFHRLQAAKEFIDSEYHQNIQVKDMAAIAYMSEFHFNRLFKKQFSLTPYQYCLQKRLDTAVVFLAYTSISINLIAEKTGFKDLHTFSRSFKTVFQVAPSEFRKKMASQVALANY